VPSSIEGFWSASGLFPALWARELPAIGWLVEVEVVQLGQLVLPALVLVLTEPTIVVDSGAEGRTLNVRRNAAAGEAIRCVGAHLAKLRAVSGDSSPDAPIALVRLYCDPHGMDVAFVSTDTRPRSEISARR
jgi:hypothetical protein